MSDYIDRDKIFSIWRSIPAPASLTSLAAAISQTPTEDVVPVVRCKDCRWGQMDDIGVLHCHKYHMHKNVDGFCDEGERREPENENTYSNI